MALHVLDEANRCLGCKKPMCQQGCPIHTNIPDAPWLTLSLPLSAAPPPRLWQSTPLLRLST